MCRPGASTVASTSCSNAYSGRYSGNESGSSHKHSKGGHGQNPSGEPLRRPLGRLTKIDQTCRYGSACRGRKSYCRYAHPVEKVVPGDWSVVVRKRRRCNRGAAEEVSDDVISDDAIIDALKDIDSAIANEHHSAISATDAMHA